MSDVFISYARSTAKQAQAVAEALRALGYSVWRDDDLPSHRAYSDVIEEQLRAATAVVVIWSAEAVKSQWVRAEADVARGAGTLVQLSIDGASLPLPFNQIQCADLAGWTGGLDAPGWRKVAASIADLTGAVAPVAPVVVAKPAEPLLAVLAFDNLSGDEDLAYFSDGVSEDRGVPEHRVRSTWDLALRLNIRFGSKEGRWSLARKRTMRLPPEADLLSVRYGGIRTLPAARRSFAGIEIQTAQGLIEFVPEQRVALDAEWRGMLGRKLHVRVGVDLVDLDLAAH